jgi:hypothetical protein
MKKLLPFLLLLLLISCKKAAVNNNEYVDITYELQANVTGFTRVQFARFYSLPTGLSGIEMVDWPISGTGTFSKTEPFRKGFVAQLYAVHPTSTDWSLKIKSENGTVLKASAPTFLPDSNHFYAKISASAQ